jgi:uncharacterized protein (TIGR02147 family)
MNLSVFEFLSYRSFLKNSLSVAGRGTQTRLANAMKCQPTYLIRVLKGTANLTEDQAYRCGRFLQLNGLELEYFLELIRMERSTQPDTKKYFLQQMEKKKNKPEGMSFGEDLPSQLFYYSGWQPSVLHLATSCPQFGTAQALASHFQIPEKKVFEIINFLLKRGLIVEGPPGVYKCQESPIHLEKCSPLHFSFQKTQREMALRSLEETPKKENNIHYSDIFATSKSHYIQLRRELLKQIEKTKQDQVTDRSEEIALFVIDLVQLS